MADITGFPQHTIAKICIAERLVKEMEHSYNNIIAFRDVIEPLIINLKEISKNYRQADLTTLETRTNKFLINIHRYVPDYIVRSDNPTILEKSFVDYIKDILKETYGSFHENAEVLNLLNVKSVDDIDKMTKINKPFIEALSSTILSSSYGSAFLDYDLDEMNISALLSVTQHNLYGASNVIDNLANITDIAENLITNFSEVADLEFVNNLLTSIPSTLESLFIDKFGNLDISTLLDVVGLGAVNEIWDTVQNLYDGMLSLTDMITGGVADMIGGLGSCGCALMLSVNNIGGSLRSIANFSRRIGSFVGQLNSTIQNVSGLIEYIDDFSHEELVSNIDDLIRQIKDPNIPWVEIGVN